MRNLFIAFIAGWILFAGSSDGYAGDGVGQCSRPKTGVLGALPDLPLEKFLEQEQSPVETLRLTAKEQEEELSRFNAPAIDSKKLKKAWDEIFNQALLGPFAYNKQYQATRRMLERMDGLFEKLLREGRIQELTPGLQEALSKGNDPKWSKVRGLYAPLTNRIFLSADLTEQDFKRALYHELVHAYQYYYRLPNDLSKLRDQELQGELNDYLLFYYEAQANYYGGKTFPEETWNKELRNSSKYGPRFFAKMVLGLATMTISARVGTEAFNSKVAKIDQSDALKDFTFDGHAAAHSLNELVVLKDSSILMNGGVDYDLDFHKKKARALERGYFGSLPFLFADGRKDQKIFTKLHDNYYSKLGSSSEAETNPACVRLIESIKSSADSPLITWLSKSGEELDSCPAYAHGKFGEFAPVYAESLLNSEKKQSPFRRGLKKDGSEGSRPDLIIMPQLEISPE